MKYLNRNSTIWDITLFVHWIFVHMQDVGILFFNPGWIYWNFLLTLIGSRFKRWNLCQVNFDASIFAFIQLFDDSSTSFLLTSFLWIQNCIILVTHQDVCWNSFIRDSTISSSIFSFIFTEMFRLNWLTKWFGSISSYEFRVVKKRGLEMFLWARNSYTVVDYCSASHGINSLSHGVINLKP